MGPLRASVSVAQLVLLLGCASERSPQDLSDRLQVELSPEIASGGVTLERLQDGARVTLPDQMLFQTGGAELDARGRYVLTSLVQALLAPPLLQVDIAGPAGTPMPLQQARVRAVTEFLQGIQVAPNLLFTGLQEQPPAADGVAPQATTVTVTRPARSSRTDHST
jgi:outer membrane protein OmpA-like peptidoglycan-associated protein